MSNGKPFFSLIHEEKIHIAPDTKIIPKNELQKLLDGQSLLETIKADAEKYREEVVLECEKIKAAAEKEGYDQGFKAWIEQLAKLETEIENVRAEMMKSLIPIALKAAKKIVGRELETDEKTIVDIVANTLKQVATHKKITIYTNKKDLDILDKNKQKLKDLFESLETFALRERADITQGSCVIETEGGIINAQIENQWRNLEKAFEQLMKPKVNA